MASNRHSIRIRFARAFCAVCKQYLEARFVGRLGATHLKCAKCLTNVPIGSIGHVPLGGSQVGIPADVTGWPKPGA